MSASDWRRRVLGQPAGLGNEHLIDERGNLRRVTDGAHKWIQDHRLFQQLNITVDDGFHG